MRRTFLAAVACACLVAAGCASLHEPPLDASRAALAPSGKLRVALFEGNPTHASKTSAGETVGVAYDVGRKLAQRLGVPFEAVPYTGLLKLLEGGRNGEWDVAFLGVSDERRAFLDFTPDYIAVEIGYLVPAGGSVASIADVDRPGVRVAVVDRGSPQALLAPLLKNASLVSAPALAPAIELLGSRKAEVFAGQKPTVFGAAARLPGSRVLEGTATHETAALAMPRGRDGAAMAYATRFIEEAKADGTVRGAIERARLKGVVVAAAR